MADTHAHAAEDSADILDDLLNDLVDMAIERLEQADTFEPFGVVINRDGDLEATDLSAASPEEAVDRLTAEHKARAAAGGIDASGLCFDFRLDAFEGKPATDAICCRLETRLGEALTAYLPYTLHPEPTAEERLDLGELMATVKTPEIFPAPRKR